MENGKEWYIGIDFGTSNTCVVAYEAKKGELKNSNKLAREIGNKFTFSVPSCVAQEIIRRKNERTNEITEESSFYFGTDVELHPALRSFKELKRAAREITPKNGLFGKVAIEYPFDECGLDSVLEMGNDDYSSTVEVRKLVVLFLREVLRIGKDDEFGINKNTVRKIVIGCPAAKMREQNGSKVSYEDTLKGLLSECFTGKPDDKSFIGSDCIVTVISEPELAGVTYLFSNSNREKRKVLVIDIGGGTTDFSVLEYKKNKVEAVNIGSCEIAGDEIDKIIFDRLPDGIPHSKVKCRGWKERLFANEEGVKIEPYETKDINRVSIGKGANGEDFFLDYNRKEDVPNTIFIREVLEKEVFAKIGDALKNALEGKDGKDKIEGINTIFFVGGTSVITPLRKKLIDIAKDSGALCPNFDREQDVVDTFVKDGKEPITLRADWGKPLTVTCYNAVAIGACIKAMGENLLHVKPKIYYEDFYGGNIREMGTTDKDLLIIKGEAIPFAYVYIPPQRVKGWKSDTSGRSIEKRKARLGDSKEHMISYGVSREEIDNVNEGEGLLIYVVLTESGIVDYRACKYDKNPSDQLVKNWSDFIKEENEIQLIKKE